MKATVATKREESGLENRHRVKQRLFAAAITAVLLGFGYCSPALAQDASSFTSLTEWRTTLVTARGTNRPGKIEGISNRFTLGGQIYAHVTLIAEGPFVPESMMFTMKWFSNGRQIHERSAIHTLSGSPYYLVHAIPGSVVGIGRGRVELHSDERLLVAKEFIVSER